MLSGFFNILNPPKELRFQLALHLVVLFFSAFDTHPPYFEIAHTVLFFNYAFAAFIINYVLLSRFYYKKKYTLFTLSTIAVIAYVILSEELILEQIFYPNSRAKSFPGLFFSLLDVLPVISILSGGKFAWDAIIKQQEVEQLRAAMHESELQFLTSQINPHFLFNNLNNLYAYAIAQSPKTPEIILELSSVLRYMLYECRAKVVPLKKEIEQLGNFTRLSELQIEERGKVQFELEAIPEGYGIAPLILIVFIENAFKHSQSSLSNKISIEINIKFLEEGKLEFFCSNNFQQLSNTENLSKGIGLENVKKRLELLYPGEYELQIKETDSQYDVYLSLNLTKMNKL